MRTHLNVAAAKAVLAGTATADQGQAATDKAVIAGKLGRLMSFLEDGFDFAARPAGSSPIRSGLKRAGVIEDSLEAAGGANALPAPLPFGA